MNNNPRLQELGIKKLGPFRYFFTTTNRYFFWSPIMGIYSLPYLIDIFGLEYLSVYLSFVIMSRTFMTMVICFSARIPWSPFYPIILYYYHTVLVLVNMWANITAISDWTRQPNLDGVVKKFSILDVMSFIIVNLVLFISLGFVAGAMKFFL